MQMMHMDKLLRQKKPTRTRQDFQDNECEEKQNSTKVHSAHNILWKN